MSRGKRRFTLLAAVVAVAIPVTLAVMLRHRIREEWLLRRIAGAEGEARLEILEETSAFEHLSGRGLDRLILEARNDVRKSIRYNDVSPRALFCAVRAGGADALSAVLASGDEDYVFEALGMLDWSIIDPQTVSGLVPLLDSSTFEVRAAAIEAMERAGAATDDTVTALLGLLDDYYVLLREKAESALRESSFDSEALFQRFASLFQESDPGKRRSGVRLLQDLLSDSADRLDTLTIDSGILLLAAGLDDSDEEVRHEASWALSTLTPRIGPAVPALVRALERSTSDLDYSILDTLALVGETAPLTALLRHRNPWARLAGVVALDRMEGGVPPALVPAIIERLSDMHPDVREAACSALGDLGPPARAAARALREHLDDRLEGIRTEAARALWRVAGDGRAAAAVLEETVLSRNENVFRSSVWTLKDIGPSAIAAVSSLRRIIDDRKCSHRLWAADALSVILSDDALILEHIPASLECRCAECPHEAARICERLGERAVPLVAACVDLLDHPHYPSRCQAARALGFIGPAAAAALPALEKRERDPYCQDEAKAAIRKIGGAR